MGLPAGRAPRPQPRTARRRTGLLCASFAVNIGCRGGSGQPFADACEIVLAAPPARRRRVDAPGNAGLYSARMYRVYGALTALAWAAVLPCQIVMSLLQRRRLPPVRERLGLLPDRVSTGGFWIHAVSVGEMRLALRILPELRRRFPGAPVHLSAGTPTGRALAAAGAGGLAPESIGALP